MVSAPAGRNTTLYGVEREISQRRAGAFMQVARSGLLYAPDSAAEEYAGSTLHVDYRASIRTMDRVVSGFFLDRKVLGSVSGRLCKVRDKNLAIEWFRNRLKPRSSSRIVGSITTAFKSELRNLRTALHERRNSFIKRPCSKLAWSKKTIRSLPISSAGSTPAELHRNRCL